MLIIDVEVEETREVDLTSRDIRNCRVSSDVIVKLELGGNPMKSFWSGRCPSLKYLNLTSCGLESFILKEGLPNLQNLQLSSNRLADFEIRGRKFPNLQILELSGNKLTSFNVKGRLSKLQKLILCGNELTSFEIRGRRFPNLQNLNLAGNKLTSFNVGRLPKLRRLYLGNNSLESFDIGRHPNLERLGLSRNKLTSFVLSTVPSRLRELCLDENQLMSFVVEEGTFPELDSIDLSKNQLTSVVVGDETWPNLGHLCLDDNPELSVLGFRHTHDRIMVVDLSNTNVKFVDPSIHSKVDGNGFETIKPREHFLGLVQMVLDSFTMNNPVASEIVGEIEV